jgi:divalent metal cation (Fe/Co/Zn/Cd) transporter
MAGVSRVIESKSSDLGLLTPAVVAEADSCCDASHTESWATAAAWARRLAWVSLVWMATEAFLGLIAGYHSGSAALIGWAFGSAVEAAASVIVIWRFTGTRVHSELSETRARKAVAVSFWALAPYIAVLACLELAAGTAPSATALGMGVAAASVIGMPILGYAKRRLGTRLGSAATSGEGTQNLMCAAQAAAVLVALVVTAAMPSAWVIDPVVALAVAAWAIREGIEGWRGKDCC